MSAVPRLLATPSLPFPSQPSRASSARMRRAVHGAMTLPRLRCVQTMFGLEKLSPVTLSKPLPVCLVAALWTTWTRAQITPVRLAPHRLATQRH